MSKPKPTFDWQALELACLTKDDPIPEAAFTIMEYADQYNLPITTAKGHLQKLVRAGKLKSGTRHRIPDSLGRRSSRRYFWLP